MATPRRSRQNKKVISEPRDLGSYNCDTESEDEASHLITSRSEDCLNSVEHSKYVSDDEEEEETVEHSKGIDDEEEGSVDEEESMEHSKGVIDEESDIPLSLEASMNLLSRTVETDTPLSVEASMNLLSGEDSPNVSSVRHAKPSKAEPASKPVSNGVPSKPIVTKPSWEGVPSKLPDVDVPSKPSLEAVPSKSPTEDVPSKASTVSKPSFKRLASLASLNPLSKDLPAKATPDPLAKWLTPSSRMSKARAPAPHWSKLTKTKKKFEIESDSETSEESDDDDDDYKSAADSPMWSKPRRNKKAELESSSESSLDSDEESYKSANEFVRSVRKQVRASKASSPPLRRSCRNRASKLIHSQDQSSDDDITFPKNVRRGNTAEQNERSDHSSESDDDLPAVNKKMNNVSRIVSDSEDSASQNEDLSGSDQDISRAIEKNLTIGNVVTKKCVINLPKIKRKPGEGYSKSCDSEKSADDSDDDKKNVSHAVEDSLNQSKKANDSDEENISRTMEKCLNLQSVQNKKCYVDLPNISAVLRADNIGKTKSSDSEESANESKDASDNDKENKSHATEDSVDKIWSKFGQSKSVNNTDEESISKAMEKCLNLRGIQAKEAHVDLPNIDAYNPASKSPESDESANESKGVSDDDEAEKSHCEEVSKHVMKTVSGSPVWGEPIKPIKKVVGTNAKKSMKCYENLLVHNICQLSNELETGSVNYTPLKESQCSSENNSAGAYPSSSSSRGASEIGQEIEALVEGIKDNEYCGLTERLPDGGARLRQVNELLGEVVKTPRKNCEEMSVPLAAIVQSELASTRRKLALLRGAGSKLPDGGHQLLCKLGEAEKEIAQKEAQVRKNKTGEEVQSPTSLIREAWQAQRMDLQSLISEERDKMLEHLTQKKVNDAKVNPRSIIMEALKVLHSNLESMPSEDMVVEQPAGLRSSIQLFPHQTQALSWLLWRESQLPAGGILADDMGFGKTLTIISLVLKQKQLEEEREQAEKENKKRKKSFRSKATLVVCPTNLIGQWEKEVDTRVEKGRLRMLVYHGANKKWSARTLADYDLVIATYQTVQAEVKAELGELAEQEAKVTLNNLAAAEDLTSTGWNLLAIDWGRIILDDAHKLRSPRSQMSKAVCRLRADRRWCLTGAPVQNKELNLYPLVRFLRFEPFDEYRIWKVWIDDKHVSMSTLVRSVLLRRTRKEKEQRKCVVEVKKIQLTKDEKKIYLGSELRSRPVRERDPAAKKNNENDEDSVEEEEESEDSPDENDEDFNPSGSDDTDN